jgi:hypothetical protein
VRASSQDRAGSAGLARACRSRSSETLDFQLAGHPGAEPEQGGPGGHADVAIRFALLAAAGEVEVNVALGVVGHPQRVGRVAEPDGRLAVDLESLLRGIEGEVMDELDAFRIVGAHRHHQPAVFIGDGTDFGLAGGGLGHAGREVEDQAVFLAAGDHAQVRLQQQPLGHRGVVELAGQKAPAAFGDDPEVERPAVVERRDQPAGIDDRIDRHAGAADRGPVAVGQVDVAEREGARDERRVVWIELALDPVGPDPVEVVLDRLGVHEAAGVEDDAGAQQFQRLGDFGRLRKAAHPGQEGCGIEHAVAAGRVLHEEFPREPAEHHGMGVGD